MSEDENHMNCRVRHRQGIQAASFSALAVFLALLAASLQAQGQFQVVTGYAFDAALPRDFYLEGNAIPTEKRNAALIQLPAGGRLLVALLDTSGYSSQVQQKYAGMLITEDAVFVCGQRVNGGSYGFGIVRAFAPDSYAGGSHPKARFRVYDQAGRQVIECLAERDEQIGHPRPLQVLIEQGVAARLYLGRDWVALTTVGSR